MTTMESVDPTPDETLDADWSPGAPIDPVAMRETMGAFPSGVTIVTTSAGGRPVGLTISSFASVSLSPPLILVCVARSASSLPAFRHQTAVAINVLAHDQGWLARRFASRSEDRFAGVDYSPGPHGSPVLDGVSAWVSGHVERIYDAGDHVILLTRARELHRSGRPPLLYHSGALHEWIDPAAPERP